MKKKLPKCDLLRIDLKDQTVYFLFPAVDKRRSKNLSSGNATVDADAIEPCDHHLDCLPGQSDLKFCSLFFLQGIKSDDNFICFIKQNLIVTMRAVLCVLTALNREKKQAHILGWSDLTENSRVSNLSQILTQFSEVWQKKMQNYSRFHQVPLQRKTAHQDDIMKVRQLQ